MSSALLERGVLGRVDPAQRRRQVDPSRRDEGHAPRRQRDEPRVVVQVAEVGGALEAQLGGVQPVGVEEDEALEHERVRALGVGQVGRAEQLADLGQRLVEAAERA